MRALNTVQLEPFDPETVMEYEVGLKTDTPLGSGRLTTSTAIFLQNNKNVQKARNIFLDVNEDGIVDATPTIIDNTAKVRNHGGEFEATLSFQNGLTISGYYSYIKVKILEGAIFGRLGNQEFAQRGSPRHQAGLNLNWALPEQGKLGQPNLTANLAYLSKIHLDAFDVEGDRPGYALLNLRAQIDNIGNSGIGVAAFVNNVTNKLYRIGTLGLVSELGFGFSVYGEPRTYGLEVGYRF